MIRQLKIGTAIVVGNYWLVVFLFFKHFLLLALTQLVYIDQNAVDLVSSKFINLKC